MNPGGFDATTQATLLIGLVLAAVVGWWLRSRAAGRRRDGAFTELARALGTAPTRHDEFLSSFEAQVGGRAFEVRDQQIGGSGVGSAASAGVPGRYLCSATPLRRKAWRQHEVVIRRAGPVARSSNAKVVASGDAEFDSQFTVRELGVPVAEHWLGDEVRTAVRAFYALGLPVLSLDVEEGVLVHRFGPDWTLAPAALRKVLEAQAAVADALERAVPASRI